VCWWNRARPRTFSIIETKGDVMGRGILLWMLGVPIPVILLLALFFR